MPEPFPDRDRDDFVVLPDRGPKVPRIQCHARGHFQVNIERIEDDLVVRPNGFSIVGLPTEDHPNGEQRIIPPPPWPPEWWPSIAAQPDRFQIGVPTVPPPWGDDDNGGGGGHEPPDVEDQEEEVAFLARCQAHLTGLGMDAAEATTACQNAWNEHLISGGSAPLSTPAAAASPQARRARIPARGKK